MPVEVYICMFLRLALILRGLDGLTMEENIISAFASLTSMLLKNVRVVRDRLTGASSGFAFVELHSLKESQDLLQYMESLPMPLEVDGKALIVNYAKNTFTTAYVSIIFLRKYCSVIFAGFGSRLATYDWCLWNYCMSLISVCSLGHLFNRWFHVESLRYRYICIGTAAIELYKLLSTFPRFDFLLNLLNDFITLLNSYSLSFGHLFLVFRCHLNSLIFIIVIIYSHTWKCAFLRILYQCYFSREWWCLWLLSLWHLCILQTWNWTELLMSACVMTGLRR